MAVSGLAAGSSQANAKGQGAKPLNYQTTKCPTSHANNIIIHIIIINTYCFC